MFAAENSTGQYDRNSIRCAAAQRQCGNGGQGYSGVAPTSGATSIIVRTSTFLRHFARRTSSAMLPFVAAALIASHGFAYELTYVPISTPFPIIVSLDYFEPTNSMVAASYYPNGSHTISAKLAADGTQSQYTNVSNLTDEIKVATARSPAFGGFAGSPFAPGTMFSGNGPLSQIVKVDPAGNVNLEWSTMPNGAAKGRFWGLQVDRTGVFNGDLIGATSQGYIYRINGAGVATQLAWVNNPSSTLQSLITVPNDPLIFGGLAGKILIGSETDSRLYYCDAAGSWGWWTVPVAIDDLEIVRPNENFFGDNYGGGNLLGVSADQFESQGLVGKILVTKEFVGLHVLTWDFGTNTPHFEQINTAAGSVVPQHWEDITFAPAGVAEIDTTLPIGHYQISGAFGLIDNLDPVAIPKPLTVFNRYNYGATPNTGTPPEARINKGVMSVVEDYKGGALAADRAGQVGRHHRRQLELAINRLGGPTWRRLECLHTRRSDGRQLHLQ